MVPSVLQDLVQSEKARAAATNNSASLTAELQLLKSFCDSQTHKLAESGADLYISDHLRKGLEQRLEELTAQRDRLAYQAESLRNGKFDQDREVRAAEFKCVNLRQQLAEAHSAKTELTLHAYELTAEKLAVCGQLLQVRGQNTQLASELTIAVTEKGDGRKQLQQLQRGNGDLSAQLTAALSGKAAAEQHAQQLQAGNADSQLSSQQRCQARLLLSNTHSSSKQVMLTCQLSFPRLWQADQKLQNRCKSYRQALTCSLLSWRMP